MRLVALLSSLACVGGGLWMLVTQPADPNSIFGPLLHGIGLAFVGIGLYVGPSLLQKWRAADALERLAPPPGRRQSERDETVERLKETWDA